jgi:NMD protein affecting ribosome stability and mRNA decay
VAAPVWLPCHIALAGFTSPVHLHPVHCPACRKIKAHSVSGELQLRSAGDSDRDERISDSPLGSKQPVYHSRVKSKAIGC